MILKEILKKYLPKNFQNKLKSVKTSIGTKAILTKWKKDGYPIPPPHVVKQLAIKEYQKKYNIYSLVETGTYKGDMVYSQLETFDEIISIEFDEKLYKDAFSRFKAYPKVKILQGNSGNVLNKVMPQLKDKALFWLDGHYVNGTTKADKECPIYEELDAIFSNDLNHILLIDDARCFVGQNDYPTIEDLSKYIKSRNPKYVIEVKHDIIRATTEGV